MSPPFPAKFAPKRIPPQQRTPANQTGMAMTGALTQAGTRQMTTERGHDTPPDKTHSKPKPAVAIPIVHRTIGVCSKFVLTKQRKGKPDAMRS
jgi:hypothetical protein